MNLESNIQARIDAEQMAELCGHQNERFWEVLANIAAGRYGIRISKWLLSKLNYGRMATSPKHVR